MPVAGCGAWVRDVGARCWVRGVGASGGEPHPAPSRNDGAPPLGPRRGSAPGPRSSNAGGAGLRSDGAPPLPGSTPGPAAPQTPEALVAQPGSAGPLTPEGWVRAVRVGVSPEGWVSVVVG
ncbi:hypothetical protein SVIO_048210 [Streptomyces violaceusniger]|uniref:Uncharacterized protein n=1 Tax=Streptomyces violaceusniger TaxID=68280 RepID=A0A4D4L6M6_STRVO|nr:hypothetical protein SVIO_048210 [Streptomyces violaceusniger]